MCRQLLGMKGEVEKIKKIQSFAQKTDKQTSLNADSIQALSDKVEADKKKQDKRLESLDAAVRDEEATRVLEHKRIKKVAQELEKQQWQIDYDTNLAVKNLEVTCRQECLAMGVDLDKKLELIRNIQENAVNNVHASLKEQILTDQDVVKALTERVVALEKWTDEWLTPMENQMYPQLKTEKNRWKIDYEDLKGWLTDTIDARLKDEKARIQEENDKKYKAIILK